MVDWRLFLLISAQNSIINEEGAYFWEMKMMGFCKLMRAVLIAVILFIPLLAGSVYGKAGWKKTEVELRVSKGLKITSVSRPVRSTSEREVAPYPEPPLGGFTPLVAITASNKSGNYVYEYEHVLHDGYAGIPLNSPVSENFVIGVFDSGAVVDLAAGASATTLGLEGDLITDNTIAIGGFGETIYIPITEPLGFFAGGLEAINEMGLLDPNYLVGHSNVSMAVAPEISCNTGDAITAVAGTGLITFFTTVIRNDNLRTVTVNGQTYTGPDVQILDYDDPSIPTYSRSISMELGASTGEPTIATTAVYFPDFDLGTPLVPTMLSYFPFSLPTGALFFENITVREGEEGSLRSMRVLVDTGAQISVMTEGMAANLSLPFEPDFTVDVCGVGGLVEDVPGYYIDFVRIDALGGEMQFSNAPFIVIDLGGDVPIQFDGILGMNFFWNRNIIFDPSLTGSSFLHVSDPVPFADADVDDDGDTDLEDFAVLSAAWEAQADEGAYNPACDMFIDTVIDMKDLLAFLDRWLVGAAP